MTDPSIPPTTPAIPDPATGPAAPTAALSEDEALLRARYYLTQRLDYQADYYQKRIDEFSFNADQMLILSSILMGISTIISSSSVFNNSPVLPLITALLPAFATGISAFRSLYQWERQASVYEDAWLQLQHARLAVPDEDYVGPGDYERTFPQLVAQTEEVLRNEAGQWGQILTVPQTGENQEQPNEPENRVTPVP